MTRVVVALGVLGFSFWRAADAYASVIARGGGDHQTADWLISYAGGFVRRGLFGEAFWAVAPTGQAGLWALYWFQVACWAVVVAFGVQYLVREKFSWASVALVCGPAAWCFPGWDPAGGFRKEILVFVALCLLGWVRLGPGRRLRDALLTGLALLFYALAVFSWEASAVLLPAVLWLVLVGERGRTDVPGRPGVGVAFLAISVVGVVASALAHGDAAAAAASCEAIRAHGFEAPGLCNGAVRWLGLSTDASPRSVAAYWPRLLAVVPLLVLGTVALWTTPWLRRNAGWAAATTIAVLPLFVIALDYGRWTHMLVMALAICVASSVRGAGESMQWTAVAACVYVMAWGVPHSLNAGVGWLGFLQASGQSVITRLWGG